MSVSLESLGIDRMTVAERLDLIETIWDSLPESIAPEDVPESHLIELAHRYNDALAHPGQGKPWRDVLDSLGKQP